MSAPMKRERQKKIMLAWRLLLSLFVVVLIAVVVAIVVALVGAGVNYVLEYSQ